MNESAPRLGAINGLRGVATLMVIYHHLAAHHFPAGWHALSIGHVEVPVFAFLTAGEFGVQLFFILSGFVLFLPYAGGERDMATRADITTFYSRRSRRLLPLYYLSLAVAIIFHHHLAQEPLLAMAQLALMVSGLFVFTPMFYPSMNWVLWSLGIEIWFSVLFPILVYQLKRIGMRNMLLASLLLSFLTQLVAIHVASIGYILHNSLFARLPDFIAGMFIAQLYIRNGFSGIAKSAPAMLLAGLVVLQLAFVTADMAKLQTIPRDLLAVTGAANVLGFSLLVVASLHAGLFSSLLSWRPLQWLGMMCFSIYIWHGIVMVQVFGPDYIQTYTWHGMIEYFLSVAAISVITFRYVEFGHVKKWADVFRTS